MIELIDHNATSATFITAEDIPPVSFEFVQIDLTDKTPQEAFLLGMAHSLYHNRGIPIPIPAPVATTSDLETEVI